MEQFAAIRHQRTVPAGILAKTEDRTVPPFFRTKNTVFTFLLMFRDLDTAAVI
jgi:hypothetical protein